MKVTTVCKILLFLIWAGFVGFVEFDVTGLTQDFGLFNAQSLTRIAVFLLVEFCFLILNLNPSHVGSASADNLGGLQDRFSLEGLRLFIVLYAFFSLSLLGVSSLTEGLLLLYRIGEWTLVILLCARAFPLRNDGLEAIERRSLDFLKTFVSIPVVIVLAGVFVAPSLASYYSLETQTFRLGGYIQGPNVLAVLAGIGAALFWSTGRTPIARIWAIVLIAVMFLTWSRGGMAGFFIALIYAGAVYGGGILRLSALVSVILITIWFTAVDSAYLEMALLETAQRGSSDSLLTLNNRTEVWAASFEAISNSPFFGTGFIVGPKNLGELEGIAHWKAPHAHNDMLNARVGGGIFAAFLVLAIYVKIMRDLFVSGLSLRTKILFQIILMQVLIYSILTPVFSGPVVSLAIVLLIIVRCVASVPRPLPGRGETIGIPSFAHSDYS